MIDAPPEISNYFNKRAHLSDLHCDFECHPSCQRPGCRSLAMQIPATVFDLLGAAAYRREPITDTFLQFYRLGLLPVEGQQWIVRAALKISKPCRYLQVDKCSVYPVRPLACVLFPEYLAATGALPEASGRPHFRDYLCLQRGFQVSPQRRQVARRLNGKLQRELLVSDWYFFGCSPFFVDLRGFQAKCTELPLRGNNDDGLRANGEESSSICWLDGLFRKTACRLSPFKQMDGKLAGLEDREVQEQMFAGLEDDRRLKRLARKCHDTERVFRIKDGRFKAKRTGSVFSSPFI